jgi:hypothetical protein
VSISTDATTLSDLTPATMETSTDAAPDPQDRESFPVLPEVTIIDHPTTRPIPLASPLCMHDRKHKVYYEITVNITNDGDDIVAKARATFLTLFKRLVGLDKRFVWYPYVRTTGEEGTMYQPKDFPRETSRITTYIRNWYLKAGVSTYPMYSKVRFGHESEGFEQNARAICESLGHRMFRKALQHPHEATLGFIYGAHEKTNLDEFHARATRQFAALDHLKRETSPLLFGLRFKALYDGSKKDDKTRAKTRPVRAIHIEVPETEVRRGKTYFKTLLGSNPWRNRYNIVLRLLPTVRDSENKAMARKAVAYHTKLVGRFGHIDTVDFPDIDKNNPAIKDEYNRSRTLRDLLLAMRTSTDKPLFLSFDRSKDNPNGYTITYPEKHETEARNKVKGLYLYLHHQYNLTAEDLDVWFTQDAQDASANMKWDPDRLVVITVEELEMTETFGATEDLEFMDIDLSLFQDDLQRPSRAPQMEAEVDMRSLASRQSTQTNLQAAELRHAINAQAESVDIDDSPLTEGSPATSSFPAATKPNGTLHGNSDQAPSPPLGEFGPTVL